MRANWAIFSHMAKSKGEEKRAIGVRWPDDDNEWICLMGEKERRERIAGVSIQNSSLVRALVRERIEEISKGLVA